ncbi:nucleotidyltransferase domain-containing protein [Streptomyces flavofungini]|uniref:nucleotidyltransferase domain-containing protein n=1 Tax=Streptomyces flavofungini TaxID=68200 RepID=UPI0025B1F541|nr:nucleotidyltransferase domain-containing protein [Streptomyces flavofungini]WJV50814.1 nucleotidyltransferase domain-containing protein [Streptomyces flavofungini]
MTEHGQDQGAFRAAAARLVAARHPHALGALLGGSAAHGRATASSDLDVAVLLPDRGHSGREVVRHEGRVAELFLNTVADLPEFFAWDRARRRGTVLFLYDRGVPLADPHGHVARTRELARQVLASGPAPLTPQEREYGRYALTCYVDDLVDLTTPGDVSDRTEPAGRYEQLSVADHVLREAAHLPTAHHHAWTGVGKWLPRRLLEADPVLGAALLRGHRTVAERADPAPLAAAARQVLDLLGGPLREGYAHRWTP